MSVRVYRLTPDGLERVLDIVLISMTALRLVLLPLLAWLVLSPIVRFEAADEQSSLLEPEAPGSHLEPSGNAYGTFEGDTSREPSRAATPHPTTGPNGTNSPSGIQKTTRIPKKLGEKKEDPANQGISWTAFWARIWKLRSHLWPSTNFRLQVCCYACILLLGVTQVVNIFVPLMLGKFVDALTKGAGGSDVNPWPWFVIWISLRAIQGGGLLNFLQNLLWLPVQQYADREMQLLLFGHLLDLSLKFHTKRNTGEVLKIIDRGSAINNLLQILLFSAIPTLASIIITPWVLFHLFSGSVSLVLAVVMVSYLAFSIVFTSYRTKLRRQMVERDIKTRGIASDVLTNWESVKYFTAERREINRFGGAVIAYQETERQVLISFNLLNLVQAFIITLGLLTCSLLIANSVLQGAASVGDFVMFLQYLQQLIAPLDRFGTLYRQLNANATDAEKLFNLLQQPTEIQDAPGAKDLVITDGVIEFDNVWFSYDGDLQALKGVSFRIGKGQSMALVGESGSGKSTILRLLYRFYDIDSGHIYIDGQDISKVTQKSLRDAIGIVPQDSVLWNDTIAANIGYGREGASDEQIIAAAKAGRLHDRIMTFPEEYATVVGERGVRLSGGEKQRVSLARMFLKSPAILVLDEATSALDTETEREIQKSLAELAQNRSSLSIAHRLSTIINSDIIVVMKNGQVIERGNYKELVELDGQFATMWKKQIFTEAEFLAETHRPAVAAAAAIGLGKSDEQAEAAAETAAEEEVNIQRSSPPSTVAEGDDERSSSDKADESGQEGSQPDNKSKPQQAFPAAGDEPSAHATTLVDLSPAEGGPSPLAETPPMTRTPSVTSSHIRDPATETDQNEPEEGKRRKRLSSLKGFVRRMSEERAPLLRSNSTKSSKSGKSGLSTSTTPR